MWGRSIREREDGKNSEVEVEAMPDAGWDQFRTVIVTVFGTLMSIVAYLFKRRIEAYDKHLEECQERAVVIANIESRLTAAAKEVSYLRSSMHWVGDCMVTLGAKLDVKLPPRPEPPRD
jgi:hypothetical protein